MDNKYCSCSNDNSTPKSVFNIGGDFFIQASKKIISEKLERGEAVIGKDEKGLYEEKKENGKVIRKYKNSLSNVKTME